MRVILKHLKNQRGHRFQLCYRPPNVTGQLHIGHSVCRTSTRSGCRALITRVLLHKTSLKKRTSKRQTFSPRNGPRSLRSKKEVWQLEGKVLGSRIVEQMKYLIGDSCMRLKDRKKAYRGTRLINWSPKHLNLHFQI